MSLIDNVSSKSFVFRIFSENVSPSGDSTGTGGQAPQREDLGGLSHDKSWENTEDAAGGSRSHLGCHIGRQIRAPTVTGQKLCEEPLDRRSR